jgi:hypothetical protein
VAELAVGTEVVFDEIPGWRAGGLRTGVVARVGLTYLDYLGAKDTGPPAECLPDLWALATPDDLARVVVIVRVPPCPELPAGVYLAVPPELVGAVAAGRN